MILDGKKVLVTGGTGSLGHAVVRRLLTGELGRPEKIIVMSRDEAKQHFMKLEYKDDLDVLDFKIADIRDYRSVSAAMSGVDIVFNAAALKHVPACEYYPFEAVRTNIGGPENIVKSIVEHKLPVEAVIGISTDKACKPANVMGMTKAIQERLFIKANLDAPTRFACVRFGNVMGSRGSVIPLFQDQIAKGGPVTVTCEEMTRFMMSLDEAVDTVFDALRMARRGETLVPRMPSATVGDLADAMINGRPIDKQVIGIRPGEKMHELLVSDEEALRTTVRSNYYVIEPGLPEMRWEWGPTIAAMNYSSEDGLLTASEVRGLLIKHGIIEAEEELVPSAVGAVVG